MLTRSTIHTCSDDELHQAINEVCNSRREKPNWYDEMVKDEIIHRARSKWFKTEKQEIPGESHENKGASKVNKRE